MHVISKDITCIATCIFHIIMYITALPLHSFALPMFLTLFIGGVDTVVQYLIIC